MKHFFLFSFSLVCSLAHATTTDDLRHAIMNSDVKQVLQLLPSFSEQEKNSFLPLAQEILTQRARDYEAYRIIPKISFPVVATGSIGLAAYFHCASKRFSYTLAKILILIKRFGLYILPELAKDPNFRAKLLEAGFELNITSDFLSSSYNKVEQDELNLDISQAFNTLGIVAGVGLVATSVWMLFHSQQQVHDTYMHALEIKYLLMDKQEAEVTADRQDATVQS